GESIAAIARKAIVQGVVVLIGIARNRGVNGPSGAVIHDGREFPIVKEASQNFVAAMEQSRLGRERGNQSMALVGDAWSPLGAWDVRVLHGGGLPRDESVLAIVDRVRVSVGKAHVNAARHAAIQRKRSSRVVAGSGALEFVDGAELC